MRGYFIVILLLVFSILINSCTISGNSVRSYSEDMFDSSKECVLSLCDCKCYLRTQTPEELENKICGNDCSSQFNVKTCIMSDNVCIPK